MFDLARLEADFNQLILDDRGEEAIERFYAEDASLQENLEPPIVGKAAILERERSFASNVASSKPAVLHGSAVGDGVTFSEWTYEMTFKDGRTWQLHEVARRQWKDGKVVHERFYYRP
jgi:hypothetical protein